MYKELIGKLSSGNKWVKIQPPCPKSEISYAEKVVGHPFPKALVDLLFEMNGDRWCLLSSQEIVENVNRNKETWLPLFEEDYSKEEYLDRVDRFIFFATNGCGDYYCYRVQPDGIVDETTIYVWEHEEIGEGCCWRAVASGMTEFITRYYQGEI